MRFFRPATLVFAAALVIAFAACRPPAEGQQVKEKVDGPPDLVKSASRSPGNQSFQIRAFHLNHVWSGPSGRSEGEQSYRVKVTVWDFDETGPALAELYFHDTDKLLAGNADPNHATRPYQIHFPMTALTPILGTLRNTNEPIFLYYYDGAWAFGTYSAEPVGID